MLDHVLDVENLLKTAEPLKPLKPRREARAHIHPKRPRAVIRSKKAVSPRSTSGGGLLRPHGAHVGELVLFLRLRAAQCAPHAEHQPDNERTA